MPKTTEQKLESVLLALETGGAEDESTHSELKEAIGEVASLIDAAKLAMRGCGSAIWVTDNEHNFQSRVRGGMDFFRTMGVDAQRGYDAVGSALEVARWPA